MQKKYEISSEIYSEAKIQEAIEDFSDVAKIEYADELVTVSAENNDESDEIFREFMNYLLSI